MDKELKAKWVSALRGGKYRQARGVLRRDKRTFCCIGVGVMVLDEKFDFQSQATMEASMALGLDCAEKETLVDMNDYQSATFAEIADYIESNL